MDFLKNPLEITEKYHPKQEKFPDHEIEAFRGAGTVRSNISGIYHENTKIHQHTEEESAITAGFFLEDENLREFPLRRPTIEHAETVSLPAPSDSEADLYDALRRRTSVRTFDGEPISAQDLSDLLDRSAGPTRTRRAVLNGENREKQLRAYPSGGGLYPVKLYPVLVNVDGVSSGVYYYENDSRELKTIETTSEREAADIVDHVLTDERTDDGNEAAVLFLTADFRRSKVKYGERGYRYALQESGHLCQNVLLVATALGVGAYPRGGFYDDRVNDLLRVDGTDEAAVYAICLGVTSE